MVSPSTTTHENWWVLYESVSILLLTCCRRLTEDGRPSSREREITPFRPTPHSVGAQPLAIGRAPGVVTSKFGGPTVLFVANRQDDMERCDTLVSHRLEFDDSTSVSYSTYTL